MHLTKEKTDLRVLAADIVSAYVSNNPVPKDELPTLIAEVYSSLSDLPDVGANPSGLNPAVPIAQSVTHDWIICLEDGRRFKSLKRHLARQYGMTPDQYRCKWGLPGDYPMVAPSYSERRAEIAKEFKLGYMGNGKARGRGKLREIS